MTKKQIYNRYQKEIIGQETILNTIPNRKEYKEYRTAVLNFINQLRAKLEEELAVQ